MTLFLEEAQVERRDVCGEVCGSCGLGSFLVILTVTLGREGCDV